MQTLAFSPVYAHGSPSLATIVTSDRTTSERLEVHLLTKSPDMAQRLWSPAFAEALENLLAQHTFDIVQVEGIEMVPYALPYLPLNNRPRFVYDAHNAEADLQASAFRADIPNPGRLPHAIYSALQTLKLRFYEGRILREFDLVCAVSEADVEILHRLGGTRPLFLPNGIDSEAITPTSASPAPDMIARGGPHLVFTGKLDFRPNVDGLLWFTHEILPHITTERGTPTLWAVGQTPHAALDPLRHHPRVVLTGHVSAVEPYIAGADVVVVPLRMGSGTRLKVLQALSMAKPVVGTTLGCTGLHLSDGKHLLLEDEPVPFTTAISQLLVSPDAGVRLGQHAREHVQRYFDRRVLVPTLEHALLQLGQP